MNEPLLTILTVNFNSSDFIETMLYGFQHLTKNSYKVLICDNGSNHEDLLNLKRIEKKYNNTKIFTRIQKLPGSLGHGEALDYLIKKSKSKYTVVMDADCCMLMKHWDQFMINKLDDKVKIVGTTSPKNIQKYKKRIGYNFPLPFACLFDTKVYKKLKVSCKARNIKNGEDTCWEWNSAYLNNGFSGANIYSFNTRVTNIKQFNKITGCEVFYSADKNIFCSHFGRGSTNGAHKYSSWYYKYIPLISRILRKIKGLNQRKLWIRIVKKIVKDNSFLNSKKYNFSDY